jgi:predicted porin
VVSALMLGASLPANAQAVSDAQIKALQHQIDQLQRTVNQLMASQKQAAAQVKAADAKASQAQVQATQAQVQATKTQAQVQTVAAAQPAKEDLDSHGHSFLERKKGKSLTFYTPGGEITAYGNIDVSLDATSKNVGGTLIGPDGNKPIGNFGWQPAISTNLSYFGVRGFQELGNQPFQFVYQFEGGFDVSATPGAKESNSNQSNGVTGALFSRNSYIGLASPTWGALKIGKTDAPYKNSTASFNPFSGELGDYAVIMGNTGGDNRVEFGTRLDHSIWYESPRFAGGFNFNFLFSPGQNRSDTSDNIAAGESDCAGGNVPESGADYPVACNDGSFSNVVSTNLSYTNGPLFVTAAYEFHGNVNRQSDITASYGVASGPMPTTLGQQLFNQNVANEDAAKIGARYTFPSKTTVGAIVESMHRYVPSDLSYQNERQRFGTWFFVSQTLSENDSIHFGWAHAFRAPGDPGQHNDSALTTADGASYAANHNQADMLTLAFKHMLSPNLTWYTDLAATINGPSAHYDLGAGGRGVTTDCHDASGASGGLVANPHCWTGTTLMGVSSGLKWTY